MTSFLLMRHAEPDYSFPAKWNTTGWGADLAPLTEKGEAQVSSNIEALKKFNPQLVLCSPTTRTLHCALILRGALTIPFKVEFDLHEWVPDKTFQWKTLEDVLRLQADFYSLNGEYPLEQDRPWETKSNVKKRATQVLRRYLGYERVLVICHGMLIESLTGKQDIKFVELISYTYEEG